VTSESEPAAAVDDTMVFVARLDGHVRASAAKRLC
jgi:hypothetical protein